MKRNLKIVLGALGAYLVILILLTLVESGAEGSTIKNIWDALWYSVITLTTVGYGDMSPVTGTGRVLGIILALCSLGVLSTFISVSFRVIGEQFLPMARLARSREKQWYVFNCANEDAITFAREISRNEECVLVFQGVEKSSLDGTKDVVCTDSDIAGLKEMKDSDVGIMAFLMKEDHWENYCEGLEAAELSIPSYCMSDLMEDSIPENLHLFGKAEGLGRWYWRFHPLMSDEKCVVLIGCGKYGSAVLERALLTNVYTPDRTVEYHVFEDEAGFEDMHAGIVSTMTSGDDGEDKLVFHEEEWHEKMDLMRRADRIILCRDDDTMNLDVFEKLSTWFGLRSNVHVRLSKEMRGVRSFGWAEQILTKEYVMKDALNKQAVLMHEIYSRGALNSVPWKNLSYFLKQSNIAAADHLLIKIRFLLEDETITAITPENCSKAYEIFERTRESRGEVYQEMEHRRWMRFYLMHNWSYNEKRDKKRRHHPLLRPYDELDPAEQKKDAYAWEMLGSLYS